MLKTLQARLHIMTLELPDVPAGFRKGRGTRDQIANIRWIAEKQENSRKTSTSASLTMLKPLTVWITTNCGEFLKRWEYQSTSPTFREICMQVKKQQLELGMKQQTGAKLGKDYVKAVYCHPAYLTSMQSSVQFSSVVLRPHKSQHARPPSSSPSPRVHSDSRPSSL